MSTIIPSNSLGSGDKMEESDDDLSDNRSQVTASDSGTGSDGEGGICSLLTCASCLVSIESANLHIHNNDSGCQIFGKITIDGFCGVRYYIYKRSEDEADTIPAGKDFDLTLCGPKYFVKSYRTDKIYVNLYEKHENGVKPLICDELLMLDSISWIVNHEPIRKDLPGDLASLTVWFTKITPAVTVNLSLTVLNGGGRELVVSGHVKAIQTIPESGGIERELTLLRSESGVKLHSGESAIPLDRSVVVAPVQHEIDKEEDWGWLTIVAELNISLEDEDGQKNYRMVGREKFGLDGNDPYGVKYERTIKGKTTHKYKLSSLCDDDDDLEVKMVVTPLCDLFPENQEGDTSY